MTKDTKSTGNSKLNHKASTLAVVNNGVAAGKFNSEFADGLLSLGDDDATVNTIRQAVKRISINPDNLEGKIPAVVMPLVTESFDDLRLKHPAGDMNMLKEHAPEVYKAKFFEKNDRMPAERNGKPL